MSEHRPTVTNDPDQGGSALDAELLPEDYPDDRPLASRSYGTTEAEQARGESLRHKLRREVPDLSPDDDRRAEDAEDDSPDILSGDDEDADPDNSMVSIRGRDDRHSDDSGQPLADRSAEESAMHLIDRDSDLEDVTVSRLSAADAEELVESVLASSDLHHPWVEGPRDLDAVKELLANDPERFASFVIRCDDGMVGMVQVNEIVRGRFQSAYLGYYAFAGFDGRGLMCQGMRVVLAEVFDTMGLHRVEANIQPGNTRSIRLVERLGFRREGYSRDYLHIDGEWRDHERWALLASDPR